MRHLSMVLVLIVLLVPLRSHGAGDAAVAAQFINALGLDLLSTASAPGADALLSPYSIQSALAMTYAGADGDTKREMAAVLHYEGAGGDPHEALNELQAALDRIAADSAKAAATEGASDPFTYVFANRLFGQDGYDFRESFTGFIEQRYRAPMQLMNFQNKPDRARVEINAWVDSQTKHRIRDLIPPGALNSETRLVLVNALYLKAPWSSAFAASATLPRPFHIGGRPPFDVPTMRGEIRVGYEKRDDYTVVTVPYLRGRELQLLILIPDALDGLAALEKSVTPELLSSSGRVPQRDALLCLPKLKLEPPVMKLNDALMSLGMKTAFDKPQGSANFDLIAPRQPDDYLRISAVFHKAFMDVDEKGTEAAAATAVGMAKVTSEMPGPIEVKIDRPFLFAIQHRASGACLFLGRVVDPR